ncbi:hypothetical protein [Lichenihabitans psoromatis]|uniref:hypothetical protein n=1 Tax=Lichenihabitans psoromatis TaxID=2528642 RepID=UPI001036D0EE|nr:hypothetical protein [Lichenihabitans psoromatis]
MCFALGLLSVPMALPGIMMTDAPGAASTPIIVTAALASLALPVVLIGSGLLALVTAFFRRPLFAKVAMLASALVIVIWATSLTLSFTWCHGDASRLGCHP